MKEEKNKKYKIGLPILLGTILLLGVSYAWFTLTLTGEKTNVLEAGSLSLTLEDTQSNQIDLLYAAPMLDQDGMNLSPYRLL